MKRLLFLFLFCSFQISFSQLPCAGDSIPINSTGIAVNLISGTPNLSCLISCQCDSSLIIALPPDSGDWIGIIVFETQEGLLGCSWRKTETITQIIDEWWY